MLLREIFNMDKSEDMNMDCNLHETSNKKFPKSHVTAEMSNSSTIAGYKLVNNNKKDQDIDYKNLDFEYLISNTDTKVLEKCFGKISSFLDSASLELEFHNLSKILEEILIRIVKDVNVLTTKVMYETRRCRKLSKNIVKKANMYNSGIYFLACIYKQEAQNSLFAGLGGNSKNILVYKKVYHASVPHYFSSKSLRTPSPPSRSSSLDSEESEKPYGAPSSLTDYFKSHSLNLILKFVKDKEQTSLVFSGLTTPKAEFVHSIFQSVISDSNNDVDVKKICPQLWEAVKMFGLKYEFNISYLDSSTDKKFLLLEKVEKDNANILTEIFDMETALSMPVTGKAIKKHRDAIKHLAPDFITSSLKKLNKFLKDKTQASLIFSNVNAREGRFLKNMINYCHSQNIKILFCREAQQLFDEIRISYAMKIDFKLKIKHDNLECGDKIIRFLKMPTYVNRPRDSRSWCPAEEEIKGLPKAENSGKRKKMDCDTGASEPRERTFPLTNYVSKYNTSINFQYAGDMSNNKKDESSLVQKDPMLAKAMEKYSAEVIEPQESVMPPQLEQERGSKRIRRTTRTTQLVEALSVPVKSDKALKMMLGMGWKGGALGSRGDGITEPIMPDLNTVAGAGLGHVKLSKQNLQLLKPPPAIPTLAVSNNKRLPYKFRQQFLGELLELLKSKEDSKTIRFHPMLSKKEKSFLHHAMRSFASRTLLKMTVDEQGLVDNILLQYEKNPDLTVFARISDDKKEVVLLKRHKIATLTNKKEITIPPEITDDLCSDNLKILDSFGPLCQSQKAHETYKFRMTIILEMLKFIKNDSQEVTEMKFPEVLTSKQKSHIEKTICCINKRVKFGCNGCETSMSHEIKRNMGLFNLILKFSHDLMSFRVKKDYVVTKSKRSYTAIAATINNISKDDNIRDENEDLYMEDNIEITDSTRHKTNQIIYKNHEISDKDDEYASEIFEDMKNSVNYPDNNGLNKNDAIPSNDEGIVVEYYKLINVTEKIIENENTIDCQDTMTSTDISHQSTIPNARIFEENNVNLTTLNNSTDRIINKKVNKTDNTTKEKTVVIDSDDNSSDVLLVNATDKMSISGQSNDYSVLGIEDISMSEDKLTDWDVDSDDSEKNLNNNVSKFAEFKKKHLKKKLSKVKTDIRLVSLNKRFISTKDLVKHIQRIISYNIIQSEQFPLLKCYGVLRDRLIYSCHDKKSYDWLLDVCVANDIIMVDEEFNKMSFKINWFCDVDDNYVFDMLDLYNKNISTDEWSVVKREELEDCVMYVVRMDKESFNFILESDLSLYAGVDKVQFKIVWE